MVSLKKTQWGSHNARPSLLYLHHNTAHISQRGGVCRSANLDQNSQSCSYPCSGDTKMPSIGRKAQHHSKNKQTLGFTGD